MNKRDEKKVAHIEKQTHCVGCNNEPLVEEQCPICLGWSERARHLKIWLKPLSDWAHYLVRTGVY